MPAYKDVKGKWFVSFRYTNWQGKRPKKMKRGFNTKRDALKWEREFLEHKNADLDMSFATFVSIYKKDMQGRIKLNTWLTKERIIENKILLYFARKK